MAENYRNKLIKTFWLTAHRSGVSEDEARSFVSSIYPGKSLSKLVEDELVRVVGEFIKTTGAPVRMPKRPGRKKWTRARIDRQENASSSQIALIDNYADALELDEIHLEAMRQRAGGKKYARLTRGEAQKMIEAMKAMLGRGWKPKTKKEHDIGKVTWH